MRRWPLLILGLIGCTSTAPPPAVPAAPAEPLTVPGLENVFRVTPKILSGGAPETTAAFAELKTLGISTIISVDGTTPDVALAATHGMTYVHLPVGYDGIATDTAYKLAKAVEVAPGPVYVHCHHGRHRGPAAVAAIRLGLEPDYTPNDARAWMATAGIDPKYKGLIELPKTLKRATAADLARLPSEFPSKAEVRSLTKVMVSVDLHWDAIRELRKRNTAAAETSAILLWEDYKEMKQLPAAGTKGELFVTWVAEAEAAAKELAAASKAGDAKAAADAVAKCQSLCAKCHAKFRD